MFRLLDILAAPRLLWRHRGLFRQLLVRNISARYRGSVLGLAWSFAHPLMMLAVYTFVFGIIFKARWGVEALDENRAAFPLIMFCGLAVFNLFSESINSSGSLIVNHAGFVKKVIFPLELLPVCTVVTAFFFGAAWFCLLLLGAVFFCNPCRGPSAAAPDLLPCCCSARGCRSSSPPSGPICGISPSLWEWRRRCSFS